jgi:hypothetical protein
MADVRAARRGAAKAAAERAVKAVALAALTLTAVACGNSSKNPSATTTLPSTQAPATSTTAAPTLSALSLAGVGPGVMETPFYPTTGVTTVTCGVAPGGGVFIAFIVPAGGPPTPTNSAMAQKTIVIIVPGNAVLKDRTGKVLYQLAMASITTARSGSLVLSLNSVTYIGGDRRSVVQGAVNITGDYTCPPWNAPFPRS